MTKGEIVVLDSGNINLGESEFAHGSRLMPSDEQMALLGDPPLMHETLRALHRLNSPENSIDENAELDYSPDQPGS